MASAYHHAPTHIRRMLNQLFFEHVYLVPDQDAGQIAATATCLPPFNSILGWDGNPTDSEQTLPEGEESMKPLTTDPQEPDEDQNPHSTDEAIASTTGTTQHSRPRVAATAPQPADCLKADQAAAPATTASNQPHTPQPPGAAQTLQAPRNHQAAGGHEVASTSPATQPPNRPHGPKPPKTVQNKPLSTQKPTSKVSQDVGLSVECLVGAPLPHSNLWEACWRYVMQHMVTAQDEGTAPSSDDAASRDDKGTASTAPSPDGASQNRNTVSSPANTALHEEGAPDSQTAPARYHNRYLRPELADQMVRLYRAGHSAADIAQLFGFHRQTVARHLKRAGLSLRTNTSDPVFRLRVQQTYQTIGTIKGTARQLGVSPGAVRVVVQGG